MLYAIHNAISVDVRYTSQGSKRDAQHGYMRMYVSTTVEATSMAFNMW